MTSVTRIRNVPLSSGVAVVAAACLTSLAACGSPAARVHLPAKPHAAKAAVVTANQPATPRQQVVAAYTGYTAAMQAAFSSRSPGRVKELLSPFLDAATIRNATGAFSQAWAKNDISYGQAVQHIIGVRISGTAAWVHDCDNTSQSGLEYASTGEIVPGSLGNTEDNLVTRLNLVRGHWMVWVQTIEDVPCAP
jgi:hypothetical protein